MSQLYTIYKNNFKLGLAVIIHKTKRKAYHLPDQLFPSHELLYINSGAIYASTNGQRVLAQQGDLMLWRRDTEHGQTLEVGQEAATVGINFNGLDAAMERLSIGHYQLDNQAQQLLAHILRQAQANDIGTMVLPEVSLQSFLVYLEKNHTHKHNNSPSTFQEHQQHMLQAMNYINTHCDQALTLDFISEYVHMSPTYFSRIFKRIAGQSFKSYLTQCRIERAKALLENKDRSITEIAAACGFSTIHYFSLVFKKETGLNPSSYARRL